LCIQGAVKAMAGRTGRIVQVAAAAAKPGFSDSALNMLAKRAQDGLHDGLVRELKGSGIRFTTIYPDNIRQGGSEAVISGEALAYGDVGDVSMWVLGASHTVWIQEIVVTSPNHPR